VAKGEEPIMRLGMFTMPSHPPERPLYDALQWDRQCLRWADEYGYEEAWIGEHFTAPWEPVPAPDLLIAQAALETERIKLAPGAHLLPYHHPVELAHRVAQLDHMLQGRMILGIGAGGLPTDWEMFGIDGANNENRFMAAEALEIMIRLWEATEPFQFNGKYWNVNFDPAVQFGVLDDLWTEPPEDIYTLTNSPAECPDQPAYVEIAFERGVPTEINGVEMPLLDLIVSLATIAGAHGVGRIDMVENRLAGVKSREVYEAPAAVVLHAVHKELQKIVTTKDVDRFSRAVSLQYADTVYDGLWFTPLREALDAFVDKVQERVTGVIRMKLFKGGCGIVGRRSPFALYEPPCARSAGEALVHSVVAIR